MSNRMTLKMARAVAEDINAGRVDPAALPDTVKALCVFFVECLAAWDEWAQTYPAYTEKVERLDKTLWTMTPYALASEQEQHFQTARALSAEIKRLGRPVPVATDEHQRYVCPRCSETTGVPERHEVYCRMTEDK